MKMLFVLFVYTLYSVRSMLYAHNVNMSLSQPDLNTSTITRQSLLHKPDNDTELLGGLSLHLNHLIESCAANYD